jgi:hypothetical protein
VLAVPRSTPMSRLKRENKDPNAIPSLHNC